MNIPIVYEDEWLLVVNKPAGLLTVPTPKNESRTLISILNEYAVEQGASYHLHPCHRLDRETSGVIVFAKGKAAQKKMMQLFGQRKTHKIYLAFLHGALEKKEGTISLPLEGASALTAYRLISLKKGFCVAEVEPHTGRTNQIRLHFKHIGHAVVGETRFAFRKDYALKAKRLCLHAKSLSFIHPYTQKELRLEAPLPPDMDALLKSH